MEVMAFKYICIGLVTFGMLGSAIGVGLIFGALIKGVARNPSAVSQLTKYAFIGAGLSEAMGIFSFFIALYLLFA